MGSLSSCQHYRIYHLSPNHNRPFQIGPHPKSNRAVPMLPMRSKTLQTSTTASWSLTNKAQSRILLAINRSTGIRKGAIVKRANASRNTVSASKPVFLVMNIVSVSIAKTRRAAKNANAFSSTTPKSLHRTNRRQFTNSSNNLASLKVKLVKSQKWWLILRNNWALKFLIIPLNQLISLITSSIAQISLALTKTLNFVKCLLNLLKISLSLSMCRKRTMNFIRTGVNTVSAP